MKNPCVFCQAFGGENAQGQEFLEEKGAEAMKNDVVEGIFGLRKKPEARELFEVQVALNLFLQFRCEQIIATNPCL